ncbi:hypothetical protein K504DRAFT_447394 [Pleomassaria siparia CBS 279.74]|uniref:Uncharacterized protein n=1 Tax=Pleomassaria siparia CBS 279.74 TaxID=1314801 RepID=A0A6G1K4U6_9PLEO|nr:hypothetical protein K504DRAFT_447394 [Pleomassaria siparia CBS 279.74]
METFDPTTGQVFVETSFRARSMVTPYLNNCTGKPENPQSHRNPRGCSRLRDMALRTCVWNIEDPGMPLALPCYDWVLMEPIYRRLKETDTLTFKAWATFKTAFPGKIEGNYYVHSHQGSGGLDKIDIITKQLSSISFDSLTFLCIRNLRISAFNLNTDLLKLKNLAVLVLENGSGQTLGEGHDKLIKNWGRSVTSTDSFKRLRVLILKGFDMSAPDALQELTVFPALVLCNLDSWHVKKELKSFPQEENIYTHPNGRWRHEPTDSQRQSTLTENPEAIWKRNNIDTNTKMEMLHGIAAKYLKAFSIHVPADPIISIHYGNSDAEKDRIRHRYAHRLGEKSTHSAWFIRIFPPKQAEESVPIKRQPEPGNDNRDTTSKKRKMRVGKARDIGSMLGTFGG